MVFGFHVGVSEDSVCVVCDVASLGEWFVMFRELVVPTSSGSSSEHFKVLDTWNSRHYSPSKCQDTCHDIESRKTCICRLYNEL